MASLLLGSLLALLAQTTGGNTGPGPEPQAPGGMGQMVFMFGIIFLAMYLLVFRPQSKKDQDEKSMLEKLKKDDHVVTKSGILGVVVNVKDDEVTLRVDENQNTRIRFQKSAIAAILSGDQKPGEAKS